MRHLTPAVIKEITGGISAFPLPEEEITAITTDSRKLEPGCLFAALPGTRVDGHDFIAQAAAEGAACVLCSRFVEVAVPQIQVPDVQAALGEIAAFYRSQFDFPFIGITGSVGKTTAKEMIAAVLSAKLNTLKTEKNFNNELGVPLTIFRLREDHQAAVIEMGIQTFGEMTRLTNMVHPQIGVFTAIGDAHLEFLGDRPGVLRAKGEMVSGMPENGLIIANGDDPLLRAYDFGRRKILFGLGENCDVRATDVAPEGVSAMRCVIHGKGQDIPVRIPAFGQHMIYAALMGAAVGLELGLTGKEIAAGIATYETVGSRGRMIDTGYVTILDDCYNANPTSVQSAIDSLTALPGRKVAILGDMRELGENSPALHRQVGAYAAKKGVQVIACGPLAKDIAAGAGEGTAWYADTASLLEALPELLQKGDAVLVKASHVMGFEAVVAAAEKL
ncbi:MAG: UDP-N-acetylmuramoyl-tripeptide--D-alanyl-D-alanine ligase [Oscillospiraceae bacterium]|nr:UDP-N-acetylmuramoyl-tripeptide--D-alanyl-D-alanine ligase [Oscillospiraceae bacterium]